MKIEIIQRTIVQTAGGKPCRECEEEELQKKESQQALAEEDRITLSGPTVAEEIASGASENGSENNGDTEDNGRGLQSGPQPEAELSEEEKRALDELRTRDREVRAHEQAHLGAAGPYAKGPPSFEYQTGPDGKRYAVGGEVQIDTSEVPGNPQATLLKAQTIKRAATAPTNPSAQDRRVAAQAERMETEARRELREQQNETQNQTGETSHSADKLLQPGASPAASAQNSQKTPQPFPATAVTAAKENSADNSGLTLRIHNAFQPPASSPAQGKGNLIDIIS